jgi:hypothetical protein
MHFYLSEETDGRFEVIDIESHVENKY